MSGLLFQDPTPPMKPSGILNEPDEPKPVQTGLLAAQPPVNKGMGLLAQPNVDEKKSKHEKYLKSPDAYKDDLNVEKNVLKTGQSSWLTKDALGIYIRDKTGQKVVDPQWEEEYLRRQNMSREDVAKLVEGTQKGRDALRGMVEGSSYDKKAQSGGVNAEQMGQLGSQYGISGMENIGSFDLNGATQFTANMAEKFGGKAFQMATGLPGGVGVQMFQAAKDAAVNGDYAGAAKHMKKGAFQGLVSVIDKATPGIPMGKVAGATMQVISSVKQGMSVAEALGDAASSLGISTLATLAGGALLGPIGAMVAGYIANSTLGKQMVSQGFIGDALDSRTNEYFRDAYEDMDISKQEKAELDRMARSFVDDSAQLNALEKIKGYGINPTQFTGQQRGGGSAGNVGGGTGSRTGTGGGYNMGNGNVSGL